LLAGMRGLAGIFLLFITSIAQAQDKRPTSFVDAAAVVPGLVVEMRYFGNNNFVGERIDGYQKPVCLLTRQAAAALAKVARDLAPQGLTLKVFDCYRPVRAVNHFLRWARAVEDLRTKQTFYPDMEKRQLFTGGYIATYSGHSRGSTVDLTLVSGEHELDMGTPFDFLSPRSAASDVTVSAEAHVNRALLAKAMRNRGFRPYAKEWWHFTLQGEPFPGSYFDFPVR
jgi:D-alanyl-D-alanine dipeptidase